MSTKKSVLLIGIDPSVIDYASLAHKFPDFNETKLRAGLNHDRDQLIQLGYDAQWCFVDLGATAEAVAMDQLKKQSYDCVLIGAGVRTVEANFILFEKLINVVHAYAPQAKLCFNTKPTDTAEAVQRWL